MPFIVHASHEIKMCWITLVQGLDWQFLTSETQKSPTVKVIFQRCPAMKLTQVFYFLTIF